MNLTTSHLTASTPPRVATLERSGTAEPLHAHGPYETKFGAGAPAWSSVEDAIAGALHLTATRSTFAPLNLAILFDGTSYRPHQLVQPIWKDKLIGPDKMLEGFRSIDQYSHFGLADATGDRLVGERLYADAHPMDDVRIETSTGTMTLDANSPAVAIVGPGWHVDTAGLHRAAAGPAA